jgi:hypothetical protein
MLRTAPVLQERIFNMTTLGEQFAHLL